MKNNVKEYRNKLGITQEQLALAVGTSKSYISQLESGTRDITNIRVSTMDKLCQALNCSANDLICESVELEYDEYDNLIVDKLMYDKRYYNSYVVQILDKFYHIRWRDAKRDKKITLDNLFEIKNAGFEDKEDKFSNEYWRCHLVPRGGYKISLGRAITDAEFENLVKKYNLTEDSISNEFVDVKGDIYGEKYRKVFTSVQINIKSSDALSLEEELRNKGIEASNIAAGRVNIRIK